MNRYFLWLIIPASFAALSCAHAQDRSAAPSHSIFVGPQSSNYDVSFASLSEAVIDARYRLEKSGSVEIVISDGMHYIAEPIIIDPGLSGTREYPLRIRAETERHVILSGAKPVDLTWSKFSDTVYSAPLSKVDFDGLLVNGNRQVRARYPNYDPEITNYGGYSSDAISPKRVGTWSKPETGIFHALHRGKWGGWHYQVEGVNADGTLRLGPGVGNNRPSDPHAEFRYIENIFEELDSPGEWFYDAEKETLFHYPAAGVDIANAQVSLSTTESLIELRGTAEAPVEFVDIEGLVFADTKMTFEKTNEPLLRSDWMIHRGAALLFEGTENSFVRGSEFKNLGGNAIFFSGYNRRSGATSNKIEQIGAGAINVVGKPSAVRSPSFTYREFVDLADMDFGLGPQSEDYPANILIEDNLIYMIGRVEKQVSGVQIAMASRVTVLNNSIYDVPRAGINIGDGTWGGHVVRGNDVFNTVLETGDHGAFNSWGRDRFWHPDRNVMNEIVTTYPELILADAIEAVVIENNRWQSDHGWDIDLDDGASNYIVRNNLCLSGGLKIREGFNRIAVNNILINNSFHPHVWFENSNDVFQRNIMMTSYKQINVAGWGPQIDSNLFPTQSILERVQALGIDSNSLYGDPDFNDAPNGDFRVTAQSPALKLGFENFPMEFGVTSDWLKEQAKTPDIPELFSISMDVDPNQVVELVGATIRSVTAVGEQSAFGLPEVSGVIVESVDPDSIADRGGLRAGDVIVGVAERSMAGMEKMPNVNALRANYSARNWQKRWGLVIVRNQAEQKITLLLR
ncbi:MAG: PDZ domain-containing protein [Litorimonas sp.]